MATVRGELVKNAKAMEDSFFARENEKLLRKLRVEAELQRRREAIRENLQIDDEALLDRLVELDLTVESVMAFTVIPLVAVAWADGSISKKEEDAVLKAAAERGIGVGSTNYQLLTDWLENRPKPLLYQTWKDYVAALIDGMDPAMVLAIKENMMKRTTAVAKAAGGFLGLNTISDEEQAVLDDIEASFG